jgi:hypothetical protein
MLGIDDKKEGAKVEKEKQASVESPYTKIKPPLRTSAEVAEKTCGECEKYSMEEAKCQLTGDEREFTHLSCLLFGDEDKEVSK